MMTCLCRRQKDCDFLIERKNMTWFCYSIRFLLLCIRITCLSMEFDAQLVISTCISQYAAKNNPSIKPARYFRIVYRVPVYKAILIGKGTISTINI